MQKLLTLVICVIAATSTAKAETALIAVSTNFAATAERLAADYEARSGDTITLITGATGKLFAQISAGAPYDAFLSADAETVTKLAERSLARTDSRFTYALGQIVLWSADPGRDLSDPAKALMAANHIAIANPDLAPYGLAARESIESMGLTQPLSAKIVTGENIGQTLTLVASGAADLGFVAASSLIGPKAPGGVAWAVPPTYHAPIRQDAAVLVHGASNTAAIGFLAYLGSDAGQAVVRDFGYDVAP